MRRVRRVEKHDAVLSVGRAFAGDDAYLPIGSCAHVSYDSRIDLERVGQLRIRRICDVVNEQLIGDRRHVSIVAEDPLLRRGDHRAVLVDGVLDQDVTYYF